MSHIFNKYFSSPSEMNFKSIDFSIEEDHEKSFKKKRDFTTISEFNPNLFESKIVKKFEPVSNFDPVCNFELKKTSKKSSKKMDLFLDYSPLAKKKEFDTSKLNIERKKIFEKSRNIKRKKLDLRINKKKKKIKKNKKISNFQKNENSKSFTDSSDEEFTYQKDDEKFNSKIFFIFPSNFEILKKISGKKKNFDEMIDLNSLIYERQLETIKTGYYDCKFCNKVFGNNQSLAGHIFKHHSE